MIELRNLPGKGLCLDCVDNDVEKNTCPLKEMLEVHRQLKKQYGTSHYEQENPAAWEEYGIEEPEYEDRDIFWCPLYYSPLKRR